MLGTNNLPLLISSQLVFNLVLFVIIVKQKKSTFQISTVCVILLKFCSKYTTIYLQCLSKYTIWSLFPAVYSQIKYTIKSMFLEVYLQIKDTRNHAKSKPSCFKGRIEKLSIGNCVVKDGKIFLRTLLGIIKSNRVLFSPSKNIVIQNVFW